MNKALFLDRDGVINVDNNYVYRIEDFVFIDGIFDLCSHAQILGYKLVVITNQAGIGRGYYTIEDYQNLTSWMVKQFAERSVRIERVYYCPYHPTAGIGKYKTDSFDRKPNPGMILKAKKELHLDLEKSILIGDKDSDIEAGLTAGVGSVLKLYHKNSLERESAAESEFISLSDIVDWLRDYSRSQ